MKIDKQKVYDYLKLIPKGKVVTYKQIAIYLGNEKLSRVVGNILHENPDPISQPCYKVVNHKGKLSNNYAYGGVSSQKEKLESDEIQVIDNKVELSKYKWNK